MDSTVLRFRHDEHPVRVDPTRRSTLGRCGEFEGAAAQFSVALTGGG
jgi:hypothetical protein